MRKLKVGLISLLVFMQMGCYNDKRIENINTRLSNIENRKLSSETAVLIAKGELSNHVDIKNFDITVIKEGIDYWEIHFTSKCTDCLDNKPYIVINKINGEVVRFYRYGEPSK